MDFVISATETSWDIRTPEGAVVMSWTASIEAPWACQHTNLQRAQAALHKAVSATKVQTDS